MEWLKSWVNQIMIAVMIAVIFELILPNGNNKKYIKMMINFYVLFVILNPVISKLTNTNLDSLQNFDYSKYFSNTVETSSTFDSNTVIESTYEKSIKQDIKTKLANKGYNVDSLDIDINKNKNDTSYGTIQHITLSATKEKKEEQQEDNVIMINTVEINAVGAEPGANVGAGFMPARFIKGEKCLTIQGSKSNQKIYTRRVSDLTREYRNLLKRRSVLYA